LFFFFLIWCNKRRHCSKSRNCCSGTPAMQSAS